MYFKFAPILLRLLFSLCLEHKMQFGVVAVVLCLACTVVAFTIRDCPIFCTCAVNGSTCLIENLTDLNSLARISLHSL